MFVLGEEKSLLCHHWIEEFHQKNSVSWLNRIPSKYDFPDFPLMNQLQDWSTNLLCKICKQLLKTGNTHFDSQEPRCVTKADTQKLSVQIFVPNLEVLCVWCGIIYFIMQSYFSWKLAQKICGGVVEEPIQSLEQTQQVLPQSSHQQHNSPILTLHSVFKIKNVSVHLHSQILISSRSKAWQSDTSPCQQLWADLGNAQCNQ